MTALWLAVAMHVAPVWAADAPIADAPVVAQAATAPSYLPSPPARFRLRGRAGFPHPDLPARARLRNATALQIAGAVVTSVGLAMTLTGTIILIGYAERGGWDGLIGLIGPAFFWPVGVAMIVIGAPMWGVGVARKNRARIELAMVPTFRRHGGGAALVARF